MLCQPEFDGGILRAMTVPCAVIPLPINLTVDSLWRYLIQVWLCVYVSPHVQRQMSTMGGKVSCRSRCLAPFTGELGQRFSSRYITIRPNILIAEIKDIHHIHGPRSYAPE